MDIQFFIENIQEILEEHYGPDAKVEHHQVYKNNGILLEGICVLLKEKNIAPTIYLNDFYREYEEGKAMEDIIKQICRLIDENQLKNSFNVGFFLNYDNLKNYLVYRVINKERNRELLKKVPYRQLQDLALVCHCLIENEEIGTGSILIHHHHLKSWKIDEEQLFADASKNSPRLEPCKVHKMSTLVKEILTETVEKKVNEICDEYPQEKEELLEKTLDQMVQEMEEGQLPMYVITNSRRYYGAASLFYNDVMEEIAELLDNDYYVIPSSVHELIILEKKEDICPSVLNDMIVDVNQTQVEEEEWLGDHAYLYCRQTRQLQSVV
ncbi:MAG: hypothetical protein IKW28_06055 [Lachnospiraceae bacterium]|nr:hypothetical protein [Lachnospiraceae bacterium]